MLFEDGWWIVDGQKKRFMSRQEALAIRRLLVFGDGNIGWAYLTPYNELYIQNVGTCELTYELRRDIINSLNNYVFGRVI